MTIRLYPLVRGMVFTAGMALLVTACDRQTPVSPSVAAPPATTVGTEIDDTVVTTRVKSALLEDQEFKGFEFKVETRKGKVQLSGFVDTQAMADRAIVVVRSIAGVKDVENGMTVKVGKVTVGNQVDDSVITAKVKSALLADPSVKGTDIAVVTSKGKVQLSGFVNSQTQIDRAISVARSVKNVDSVVNEMSIKK